MLFFRLGYLTMLCCFLLSCSTFDSQQHQASEKQPSLQADATAPNTLSTVAKDPWQIKAEALQVQPNRYLQQRSEASLALGVAHRFEQGLAYMAEKNWSQAQQVFSDLSTQFPGLSGVWLKLAELEALSPSLTNHADLAHDKQIDYLERALKANEFNYVAANTLGIVYRQKGQFELALHYYNLALAAWPAFSQARLNRGILYDLYLGNKAAALDDYQIYQMLVAQPDRQVKGWIADLSRQLKAEQTQFNQHSGSLKGGFQ